MRIRVVIPQWGTDRFEELGQCVSEFISWNEHDDVECDIEIWTDSDEIIGKKWASCVMRRRFELNGKPQSLIRAACWDAIMGTNLEHYDYVIHVENDVLIPWASFVEWGLCNEHLILYRGLGVCCGLMRVETFDGKIWSIDIFNTKIKEEVIGSERYVSTDPNNHQGSFLFHRDQVMWLRENQSLRIEQNRHDGTMTHARCFKDIVDNYNHDWAQTIWYENCKRYLPWKVSTVICYHLANKYPQYKRELWA